MASVSRFQICFMESGNGTLLLNSDAIANPLPSVGVAHWGLDFRGISVGSAEAGAVFCTPDTMKDPQTTPCGAIPDSGTTLLMGPQLQLNSLYEQICDNWDRCINGWNELSGFSQTIIGKSVYMEALLANCSDWTSHEATLNEMPTLHFHLRGKKPQNDDANAEVLEFTGNDYVQIGMIYDDATPIAESELVNARARLSPNSRNGEVPDHLMTRMQSKEHNGTMVCLPAFGAIEFQTRENGPVWILGTPLFYAFKVGYDLSTTPPSIGIDTSSCSECNSNSNDFIEEKRASREQPSELQGAASSRVSSTGPTMRKARSRPRIIRGPVRVPPVAAEVRL